ncbi:MAG: hypothetical protein ACLTZY_05035 [Alistipes indistinctus]
MTPNHTQNSVPVDPNRKKLVWKEAATGGLYLGLALVAVMVISYLGRMDATLSWVPGLLEFRRTGALHPFLRAQSLPLLRFDGILLSAKPGVHPRR